MVNREAKIDSHELIGFVNSMWRVYKHHADLMGVDTSPMSREVALFQVLRTLPENYKSESETNSPNVHVDSGQAYYCVNCGEEVALEDSRIVHLDGGDRICSNTEARARFKRRVSSTDAIGECVNCSKSIKLHTVLNTVIHYASGLAQCGINIHTLAHNRDLYAQIDKESEKEIPDTCLNCGEEIEVGFRQTKSLNLLSKDLHIRHVEDKSMSCAKNNKRTVAISKNIYHKGVDIYREDH